MRTKEFIRLHETYNPLELSPRNKSLGERRKRAVRIHRENRLRNWARCIKIPREEEVAQLFERAMEKDI